MPQTVRNPVETAPWWMHPAWVFGLGASLIGIATYWVPVSTFRNVWRSPKFFEPEHLFLTVGCAGVFTFGAVVTSFYLRRAPARNAPVLSEVVPWRTLRVLFYVSFLLTVLGYMIWTGYAIQRGMRLATLFQILSGEAGAMYEARFVYLPTVGGVTTLTQFGTATAILGALLGHLRGWRSVAFPLSILLALAIVRALVNSERFAIIELVVPAFLVALSLRSFFASSGWIVRTGLRIAPVFGAVMLFCIFTGFEYFRSWSNYFAGRESSLLAFGANRLLGYYVTSFNNGAYLLDQLEPLYAPYFTAHFAWRFPLTAPVIERLFPDPLLHSSDKWFYFPFLESGANVEFNNADGIFFPLLDYGTAGGLFYWFLAGLVCGAVYCWFCQKRPLGLLLYPVLFLSLLESPLALYWAEGRALPTLLLLGFAPLAFRFVRYWQDLPGSRYTRLAAAGGVR